MHQSVSHRSPTLDIAVIGSGIAGMSAAWLLSQKHRVTVFEKKGRIGGHTNTVEAPGPDGPIPVDTGFIVYNEMNYPNLVALFDHLNVPTKASDMSFSASVDDGDFEYSGTDLRGLFTQKRNLFRPRFWRMARDIRRFYREAPKLLSRSDGHSLSLGDYLDAGDYSQSFLYNHLLPMAAAIWSASVEGMRAHPAASFIRFFDSHGLLRLSNRPKWRTVAGGSREYVRRLTAPYADRVILNAGVTAVRRRTDHVLVEDGRGATHRFDHVLIAAHADQALAMISDPSPDERRLLGAFSYQRNLALLHTDANLMPKRRGVWSSWNYLSRRDGENGAKVCVSYWMNRLQGLDRRVPLFVTLNPNKPVEEGAVLREFTYDHPYYDAQAVRAQPDLWRLQGVRRTWFCGSYFGAGFHEDALQAGLAAAEALGGVRRPWRVADESGRIHLSKQRQAA